VSWHTGGQRSISRVRELNFGGLFITAPNPPPVGTSLALLLSVPEGEIRTRAVVRDASPREGMGVEFTEVGQEDAVRLQALIARLLSSMQPEQPRDPGSSV
jgi:hypothetical protein